MQQQQQKQPNGMPSDSEVRSLSDIALATETLEFLQQVVDSGHQE